MTKTTTQAAALALSALMTLAVVASVIQGGGAGDFGEDDEMPGRAHSRTAKRVTRSSHGSTTVHRANLRLTRHATPLVATRFDARSEAPIVHPSEHETPPNQPTETPGAHHDQDHHPSRRPRPLRPHDPGHRRRHERHRGEAVREGRQSGHGPLRPDACRDPARDGHRAPRLKLGARDARSPLLQGLATRGLFQFFNRYPVLKIHATTPIEIARKPSVIATL